MKIGITGMFWFLGILLLPFIAFTQDENYIPPYDPTFDEDLQQRLEALTENLEEDADVSELLSELEILRLRPLNLNSASANDLKRLFFLNDIQINNLISYREKFGKLISILELQSIDGFDLETIRQIQPYVVIQDAIPRRRFTYNDIARQGKSQYFLRYQQLLEEQKGYSYIHPDEYKSNPNIRYLGSPYRLYSRYRFTYYNNISIGITAEKDPGEEFLKGTQRQGFDFYSAHIYIRDAGKIKALSLGDYQIQFGQGLALWSGLAFGKSSEAINLKKNGMGLRPYTSVDENNFMRGAGATVAVGSFEFTGFYSSKFRDANVLETDSISQEALIITSLQQTGLHRTPREIENKNSVTEKFSGTNITYRRSRYHVGMTAYSMELGAEFQRNLSYYNQFDFNSRTNRVAGLDYSYIVRNMNIFGEFATSQSGGYAMLNGIMMSLDPRLSLSILHRKFSPDYQSLLSVAFSENTRVSNETGIYMGIHARLSHMWSIIAYADHFSFPWMKYRTYAPTKGYDYFTQVNFRPQRKTEIYLRYRIKNKPLNFPESPIIRFPDDLIRQNIRLHMSYPVSPSFTFKNRLELMDFKHASNIQKGYLIYQDVSFRRFDSPWAITLRYAIFDTDGYDSRIYAYENDVLYAYSLPFYSYQGQRAYVVMRYRVNRNIDLQARIAQTLYTNRSTIGSGMDQINGNTRTELKAQVRARF
jgi:hypothetical protein